MVGLIRTFIFTNIVFICLNNSCFSQDKIKYYTEIRDGFLKGTIEISLKAGWNTYWKHPGVNGFKPKIVVLSEKNVSAFSFYWPAPKILGPDGYEYLGYDTSPFIPFEISKIDKEKFMKLEIEFHYGVCKKICLVKNKILKIEQNIKTNLNDSNKINIAFEQIPSEFTSLSKNKCTLKSSANNFINIKVKNKILKEKKNINLALIDYKDQNSLITDQTFNSEEGYAKALLFSEKVSLENIDLNKLSLIFSIDGSAKKIVGC